MEIWKIINQNLAAGKKIALLLVVENHGSSPGRQGFKMLVDEGGNLFGSVGGGATEHQLVELAKKKLTAGETDIIFKKHVHRSDDDMHKSGMICSGEHTVVLVVFDQTRQKLVSEIVETLETKKRGTLLLDSQNITFVNEELHEKQYAYTLTEGIEGKYSEIIGYKDILCIIGAGHVGFALSETMQRLGFYIKLYDNRPDLDTLHKNNFADEKHIVKYSEINEQIADGHNVYVVIMSFNHANDKTALMQMLPKNLAYLGLMGSKNKVKLINEDILSKGFTQAQIDKVHAPIGIQIKSETPPEIAISIAAEIIQVRNARR